MAREKLQNEFVECPDDPDAYYKTTIYRNTDGTCTAHIPEMGRVQVAKDTPEYPWQHESFAWKFKK